MLCVFQDECLGQGSFTRVFKGTKVDIREGEEHRTQVLLKVLDANHKDYWEVRSLTHSFIQKSLIHS